MAQIEVRLPKMGESVTEATITNWIKNVGDTIEVDEPLVEVATDKVDNELPSEVAGVLVKKLFEKDQVAQVGDVIAIISSDGADVPAETGSSSEAPAAAERIEEEIQVVVASSNGTAIAEGVVDKHSTIREILFSISKKHC